MKNGNDNEKRRFSTFFDPKLLQVLIPVIIAVGSGFVAHDRSISSIQTHIQNHKELFERHERNNLGMDEKVEVLSIRVSALKLRIDTLETSNKVVEGLSSELQTIVEGIKQASSFRTDRIKDHEKRLRDLERQVDRLSQE